MTCIIGCKDKYGTLWMAGDRQVTSGRDKHKKSDPKITIKNNMLVGCSGHSDICSIVLELFEPPIRNAGDSAFKYLHNEYLPSLTLHLKHYLLETNLGSDTPRQRILSQLSECFTILIGLEGELFSIDSTGKRLRIYKESELEAIGCGAQTARISFRAINKVSKRAIDKKLKLALELTAESNTGCDNNIDVLHL